MSGYHEKEKIKLINVNVSKSGLTEVSYELALNHLPSSLYDKTIRDLKIIEKNQVLYVLVIYSNGVLVLLDFFEMINESNAIYEEAGEMSFTVFSFIFAAGAFFYVAFGRNYFFRRRIIF